MYVQPTGIVDPTDVGLIQAVGLLALCGRKWGVTVLFTTPDTDHAERHETRENMRRAISQIYDSGIAPVPVGIVQVDIGQSSSNMKESMLNALDHIFRLAHLVFGPSKSSQSNVETINTIVNSEFTNSHTVTEAPNHELPDDGFVYDYAPLSVALYLECQDDESRT